MEDIECVFESVSGSGSLFISNHAAALNLQLLQSKGIRAVLSVARSGLVTHKREDIPHYLYIPAEDHEQYDISRHFDLTNDFIEKARKETNVLIHCMAGISRSVTIVIAYLLKRYRHTLGQVVAMLQRRRRKINPNRGFMDQLKKYCQQLGVRCDFQGECISPLRESSATKQIRTYSAKKYQSSLKRPELLAPLMQIEKDIKNARLSEMLIKHDQDRVRNQVKKDKLEIKKSQTSIETSNTKGQGPQNQKTTIELEHALELKKAFSTEDNSPQKKRSTIEQKIGKIRDRLIKSDSIPRKDLSRSMQGIQIQNKENKNVKKSIFLQQLNYSSIGPQSSRLALAKPSPSLKASASKIHGIVSGCPQDVSEIKNSIMVNIDSRPFLSHARIQMTIRSDTHRWVS